MMSILVISVIAMGVSFLLVFPLLRERTSLQETDWRSFDRAVYQDQLGEIYADRAQGLMSESEAEAARIEIARRLLSTDTRRSPPARSLPNMLSPTIALCLVAFVCLGAFALYLLWLGQPGMPDFPDKERLAGARESMSPESLQDKIAETRQAIEHDTYNPGLRMSLAFLLKDAGKGDEARFQAAEAARLAPKEVAIQSDYAVITVMLDGGIVTRQTHEISMRTLALDSTQPSPRVFLGFEREQGGDIEGALAIWKDLRRDIPDGTDLAALLDRKLAEGPTLAGIDLKSIQARHPFSFPPESWDALERPPARGVSGSTARSASRNVGNIGPTLTRSLSPVEKNALETNVDIVTDKLKDAPRDFGLWMQLARSQRVLGNFDAALKAYQTGMDIQPKDMEARRGAAFVQIARAEVQGEASGKTSAETVAPKAAYDLLRGIVRDNPDDAEALYHLGIEAAHQGEKALARDYWSRVLVLIGPDAPPAFEVRAKLDALDSP